MPREPPVPITTLSFSSTCFSFDRWTLTSINLSEWVWGRSSFSSDLVKAFQANASPYQSGDTPTWSNPRLVCAIRGLRCASSRHLSDDLLEAYQGSITSQSTPAYHRHPCATRAVANN